MGYQFYRVRITGIFFCYVIFFENLLNKGMNKNKYVQLSLFSDKELDSVGSGNQLSYDLQPLFDRLVKSPFRSKFHLSAKDKAYIEAKGMEMIRRHAADFVAKRLAPAVIPNDGKQTPMRGHPVFLAQHATACCCRGCFAKWHHIPSGRTLSAEEQSYAVSVLMEWIRREMM